MTPRPPWMRSLALLPGGLLALLPAAKCPFCIAAYTGLLLSVGLGFLHNDRVLAPIIGVFLAVGLIGVAWSTRSHRRLGPLLVTVLGSAAVVPVVCSGTCPSSCTAVSRSSSQRRSGTCG